jgi:hypothetical protein
MLKKEAKWYLWDWTEIDEPSFRYENMVAVHLKKLVFYVNDLGVDQLSLHYVRDKEKREVDFLICRKRNPFLLIECKLQDSSPAKSLIHFSRLLNPERTIQLISPETEPVKYMDKDVKIDVVSASSFLNELV